VTRILICITGMPCSGKSLVAKALSLVADYVISMGDIVREEALRRGVELTPNNLAKLAKELRRLGGPDVIAREVVSRIGRINANIIVIDGVRSLDEISVFKNFGKVYIVAVHSSPKTRFTRLLARGREGDPRDWSEFVLRDMSEIELGIGSVIALADVMIVNEGIDESSLKDYVISKVRELIKSDTDTC